MIVAMTALGGLVLMLVALKLWSRRAPPIRTAPRIDYRTDAADIDEYVYGAEDWIQHLKWMPLFWVSCFATLILLVLDFHFGYSRGGLWGAVILGSLFALADLAIPFIALNGDVNERRDAGSWVLLVVFTVMSYFVIIGSTAEISTTTGAKNDVGAISFADTRKLLTLRQQERDSIKQDRGAQALSDLAKASEEASTREGGRTRCGDKCEALKKEAADFRARAAEATRKERLTTEIEALKTRLETGGSSGGGRLDADPLASAIEGMSLGYLHADGVRRYALTLLGILLVTCMTIMWTIVGAHLKAAIAWELERRGEIGDTTRHAFGLGPKYTTPAPVAGLLPAPGMTTASADPGVTLNVSLSAMRQQYANDQQLLETDALFDSVLIAAPGASVSVEALYRAYQVHVLRSDPNARYMTRPTLFTKLSAIAPYRDGMRLTADGTLHGWILQPTQRTETPHA